MIDELSILTSINPNLTIHAMLASQTMLNISFIHEIMQVIYMYVSALYL